ncbi:transposase [Streptomyces sp. NPDC045251]|uniref:transposase n=1 Tax=Streptomyces sp. NPDC045251 TaxID=3155131 RepID=UPI0033DAC2FC
MDDGSWARIEPLRPSWPERSPGPRPVDARLCLQGILYVLHQDIAWRFLPLGAGVRTRTTCWRRLDRWQQAGVFEELHRLLLPELNAAGDLDWSRACGDGSHIRAKEGAATGPSPVARRKTGSEHHSICDGEGTSDGNAFELAEQAKVCSTTLRNSPGPLMFRPCGRSRAGSCGAADVGVRRPDHIRVRNYDAATARPARFDHRNPLRQGGKSRNFTRQPGERWLPCGHPHLVSLSAGGNTVDRDGVLSLDEATRSRPPGRCTCPTHDTSCQLCESPAPAGAATVGVDRTPV